MKKRKFYNWEIELGAIPGLLFGIRYYDWIDQESYVLYLGIFSIMYNRY